ncbi:protein lap4 [Parasteatoda tepidariorum]|uniref:protein lap4 n=1 Tax=Parasteatoda tepidariorum TaxID=114398 RepID=UPI00077F9F53|nr:protein scribble homolog [Parasteatoda tepidariorum]
MFRCIPLFRGCNRQVECIDKRHCSLANVPDDVLRYPRTLEELLLDSNHIRDLPKGLFRLIKLRRLSLSDNEICLLPSDIASLVNLVELDISKNDISDIPENIKFLKSLQNADISSNPLTKLPAGFVQLKNLTVLGLNDISISRLPNDFGNLSNLQSLELRENSIRNLPPSFSNLTKLERLDLGSNEISELPALIGQLSSLQELWLDCNDLYTLPIEIENLKKLACLDVSENKLEYLPEEIGGLENLTDLHLSQNYLESLPDGIGKLSKLTIFKVDQNRLLSLTPEIGNCESLQELILTENLISELPSSIGNLVNLTNLNLDRNRLSLIPSQIGNLTRLGVLSLRENRLNFLPDETGMLKELHVLDVSGNRLQYLPLTITALNLKALWLAENQSQPMLKFQTDVNERTGTKVLTCFLLPQQEYHPESMENLLRDSGEQDSRLSWDQKADRTSSVKFVEDEKELEDKEDKETQFVRHDTPHPRELKARHNKLLVSKAKNIDGHVVAHEEKGNEVIDSFRPQRSSITSVTSSSSETSATQFKDAVQSLADIPDSDDLPEADQMPEQTEDVDSNRPLYRAQTREDLLDEEESALDSSDEAEKHVGFDTDTDDQSDRPNKLYRRDTPHHLKNKRINLIDSQKDSEKVLAILAQAADKKPISDEAPSSNSSPLPPELENDETTHDANGLDERNINITIAPSDIEIVIQKTTAGLGLSIAGGIGSTPYKGTDEGIFVSKVISGGPAEAGGLRIGDKIVSVNGKILENVTHFDAVDALKAAGSTMVMVIRREAEDVKNHPADSIVNGNIIENGTANHIGEDSASPTEPVQLNSKFPAAEHIIQDTCNEIPKKIVENEKSNSVPKNVMDTPTKNKLNLTIDIPNEEESNMKIQESASPSFRKQASEDFDIKFEILHTTLIREQNGLGLSISDKPAGVENGDGIYITKISENGAAAKDGKLQVGDKVLTINGVDMEGARQDQAVSLLSGLDRFVRLVVQRQKLVKRDPNTPHLPEKTSITLSSSSLLSQKSPKLIGLPKPYTPKIYSSGSYMANRPSYIGSYRRPELAAASDATTTTKPTFSMYTKLPGLRNDPINMEPIPTYSSTNRTNIVNSVSETNCNNIDHFKSEKETTSCAYTKTNCVNHINSSGNTEEVSLVKAGGPLGLSIIGGTDHSCHPFGADDPGIFISKIVPEGAAAKTGKLKVGDRLLKVNGAEVSKASHKDAVMALLAPTYEMTLTVRHDPLPQGWQEIVINKHPNEKLGMGIKGGVGGENGNFKDKEDEGIFISWVNSDGAAGLDGRLLPGMRIVEVNETSLLGATYQEAITALRTACDTVRLTVCDGFNETSCEDNLELPVTMKSFHSSCSIDRDDEMMSVIRQEQEVLKETAQWEKEDMEKMEQHREKENEVCDGYEQKLDPASVDIRYSSAENILNCTDQVMYSTPVKVEGRDMPSPIHFNSPDADLTVSTDESMVDPIHRARLPGAKPVMPKLSKVAIPFVDDPEQLTFSEKKRRFELVTKPIQAPTMVDVKQFSYFTPAELERMKEEEERKLASMTEEELKVYHSLEEEELNEIIDNNLFHMKKVTLEDGATIQQCFISEENRLISNPESDVDQRIDDELNSNATEETLSPSQLRALHVAKQMALKQARLNPLEEDILQQSQTRSNVNEESHSVSPVNFEDSEGRPSHCTKLT